jgi:flagellar biosynthesis protein
MEYPHSPKGSAGAASPSGSPEPTSALVALALHFHPEHERDRAPRVLAGGYRAVAEQILNIAFAPGIRVGGDADLAQMLVALGSDREILVKAVAAVAEIDVCVYRPNGAGPGGNASGLHETVLPPAQGLS